MLAKKKCVLKKKVAQPKPSGFIVGVRIENSESVFAEFPTKKAAKECFDHFVAQGYECIISVEPIKNSKTSKK